MTTEFEIDSYLDICSVCGTKQLFERTGKAIRESYHCPKCKSSLREREMARAILTIYGMNDVESMADLVLRHDFIDKKIYEPGTDGPFREYFKHFPSYVRSDYYDNPTDSEGRLTLPHQTLESLTYSDQAFDLVLTADIMEHVRRPKVAFAEIARVLRIGGYHIFTVPLQRPVPAMTVIRVATEGECDSHILPARYHGNGKGGRSLVYHDFGCDITMMLSECGFSTYFLNPETQSAIANCAVTVLCQRMR